MKITLLTLDRPPLDGRLALEAETFVQLGYQLHAVHAQGNYIPGELARGGRYRQTSLSLNGGKLRRALTLPLLYVRMLRALRRDQPDVVHCAHPVLLPAALMYKRSMGTKVVYDPYEFYVLVWVYWLPFGKSFAQRLIERIENRFAARADCILTVDSRDGILERRYRSANPRVSILYNVPRLESSVDQQLVASLRAEYAGRRLVTYVGGLHEHKGVRLLLDAIDRTRNHMANAKLLMIGDIARAGMPDALKKNLNDSIEILPWLPYDKMLAYLQVSEVGLAPYPPSRHHPLLSRGNARKIFTYMEAGLPIVGPAFGEIGQVIREEQCGVLVDTTDPARLSEAIIELLERPEWAAELGTRGRRAFIERYNWDLEQRKLIDAYLILAADRVSDDASDIYDESRPGRFVAGR